MKPRERPVGTRTLNDIGLSLAAAVMATLTAGAWATADTTSGELNVACKRRPEDKTWRHYSVRRVVDLAGFEAGATTLNRFGGEHVGKVRGTGFFRIERMHGRWWFVDPEGGRFISMGLNSTRPPRSATGARMMAVRFGDAQGWAAHTAAWFRTIGLNTLGCWSDGRLYRSLDRPLAYTTQWNFASGFGREQGRTHETVGHAGFAGDCLPVLDPAFEAFCDRRARALAETRDDPWLLGHFSDNELPIYGGDMLKRYLQLPAHDVNRKAAARWLAARYGGTLPAKTTENDRVAFRAYVAQRYFAVVAAAIRKYDPNHLYLGCRFHSRALQDRTLLKACAPYVDVLSFNWYGAWRPDKELMDVWAATGRPFLITEFYAKGMDTGMNNHSGAGWTVKTQADRGGFYQNFSLGLLEHPACIGWHWHRYQDNDLGDPRSQRFDEQSNKGFVNLEFEPYAPLTHAAAEVCTQVYGLADWFGTRGSRPR